MHSIGSICAKNKKEQIEVARFGVSGSYNIHDIGIEMRWVSYGFIQIDILLHYNQPAIAAVVIYIINNLDGIYIIK